MANEFIARKGLIALEDSVISGSLNISGSVNVPFGSSHGYKINTNRILSQTSGVFEFGALDYKSTYPNIAVQSDNTFRVLSNGSTLLYVTGSGNVGIGTTSPALPLHVDGDARMTNLLLGDNSVINTPVAPLHIKTGGTNARMRIEDSDGDNTYYDFYVNQGVGLYINEGSTTRLFVSESGNVGIGTTSPQGLFHVSSGTSGDAVLIIESDTDNNNENDNPQLQFKQDAGITIAKAGLTGDAGQIFGNSLANAAYFGNDENASVQFYTNATAALTIREDGDVGIGTTSPGARLDINGGSANGVSIQAANVGTEYVLHAKTSNGTSRLWVGGTGNVGIGTTYPSEKLHVSGNIELQESLQFNQSNVARIKYDTGLDDTPLYIQRANSTAETPVTIRRYGDDFRIGINKNTGPNYPLDVYGDGRFTGNLIVGGIVTAQEFHTEFVSASIMYSSGSTKFGDSVDDKHEFTGSLEVFSGSLTFNPGYVDNGTGLITMYHGYQNAGTQAEHIRIYTTGSLQSYRLYSDTNAHTQQFLLRNNVTKVAQSTYWPTYINNDAYASRGGLLLGSSTYTDSNHSLTILNEATSGSLNVNNVMYVSGSKVSIGTTTSPHTLNVKGTISRLNASNIQVVNLLSSADHGQVQVLNSSGVEKGLINSNGASFVSNAFGIGTSTPRKELEVRGNILIQNNSGSNPADASSLYFAESGDTWGTDYYGFRINHEGSNNYLNFQSANTTTVRDILTLTRDTARVGIGTTTPEYKLDIQGDSPILRIADDNTVNSPSASAIWMGENGFSEVRGAGIVYDGAANSISLVTSNNGSLTDSNPFNASKRLTVLESNGFVGIGTTAPGNHLDVVGTIRSRVSNANPTFNLSDNTDCNWDIELERSTNSFKIDQNSGGFNSTALYITGSNGNVGIGTTDPRYATLQVQGSGLFAGTLQVQGNLNLREDIYTLAHNGQSFIPTVTRYDGGSELGLDYDYVRSINGNNGGNVGIGTTSPTGSLLHLSTTSAGEIKPLLKLHNNISANDNSEGVSIDFVGSSDALAVGSRIIATRAAAGAHMDLRFHTQRDNFAMIIDENQNVGIGTDSPGSRLTVHKDLGSGGTLAEFKNSNATYSQQMYLSFNSSKDVTWSQGSSSGGTIIRSGTRGINLETSGSINLLAKNTGTVLFGQSSDGVVMLQYSRANNGEYARFDFDAGYYKINTNDQNGIKLDNDVRVTGDLTVDGIVTAQEFHTEFVSASIMYRSGSTKFGDTSDDVHQFTGSVQITNAGTQTQLFRASRASTYAFELGNYAEVNHFVNGTITAHTVRNTNSGVSTPVMKIGHSGTGAHISTYSTNEDLIIDPNGTGGVQITGSLGISEGTLTLKDGTSSNLALNFSSSANTGIYIDDYDASNKFLSIRVNGTNVGTFSPPGISSHANVYTANNGQFRNFGGVWKATTGTAGGDAQFILNGKTIMHLDEADEYVGIGTTNPLTNLHIANSGGAAQLSLERTDTSDTLKLVIGSSYGYLQNTSGPLSLGASGDSQQVYIATDGDVGIGTTSPSQKLTVSGSIAIHKNAEYLYAKTTGGNNVRMLGINSSDVAYVGPIDAGPVTTHFNASSTSTAAYFYTSGSIKMSIGSTGNVGIGTTSPSYKLHVDDTTDSSIGIERAGSSGILELKYNSDPAVINITGNDGLQIQKQGTQVFGFTQDRQVYINGDQHVFIQNNGSTNLYVSSSGNVGIGTTSPTQKLTVAGNIIQTSTSNFIGTRKVLGISAAGLDLMDDSGANGISIKDGGSVQLTGYGSGTRTGTATYSLCVNSSGYIIEEAVGAGTISGDASNGLVAYWDGTTSITGSAGFTFDGTTLTIPNLVETSAKKYKENIEPLSSSLEKIEQLQGVSFNKVGQSEREIGFIADEMVDVLPELVHYENGEVEGVHYARTVAVLTEAVKELNDKVKAQELFIKDLVSRIEKLENK